MERREFRKIICTAAAIASCTIVISSFAIIFLWKLQEGANYLAEVAVYTSENLRRMIDEKQEDRKMEYYINKFLEASKEKCVEAMLIEDYETANTRLQESKLYLTICTKFLYEHGTENSELKDQYVQILELYNEVYIYVTTVKQAN